MSPGCLEKENRNTQVGDENIQNAGCLNTQKTVALESMSCSIAKEKSRLQNAGFNVSPFTYKYLIYRHRYNIRMQYMYIRKISGSKSYKMPTVLSMECCFLLPLLND